MLIGVRGLGEFVLYFSEQLLYLSCQITCGRQKVYGFKSSLTAKHRLNRNMEK